MRLSLSPATGLPTCTQDISWHVGLQRSDLRAQVKLTASGGDLLLAEWDVGEVVVAEITGAHVRDWSQAGSHIQVWLQRPVSETTLQLSGWLPHEDTKGPARHANGKQRTPFLLSLRPLRILSAQPVTTHVRVTASNALTLQPQELKHLLPLPESPASEREFAYVTDQADYAATFLAQAAQASVAVQMLTLAEVLEGGIRFTTLVDYEVRQGQPQSLTVGLRNWSGGSVRLEAPDATLPPEERRGPNSLAWVIDLQSGVAGTRRLKLSGSLLGAAGAELLMPDVSVHGATRLERWLAVAGKELRAEEVRGLTPVQDVHQALKSWPAQSERIQQAGAAWKVEAADWHLRIVPHLRVMGGMPLRVYLSQQVASVVDGHRWAHQATYWLYNETGADLSMELPAGARLLDLAVDGVDATPSQPIQGRAADIPLSGLKGARRVRLSWVFAEGENLDRPNLTRPRLAGVTDGPALWTVHVPHGYTISQPDGATPGTPSAATATDHDLRRAETQLELSGLLAESIRFSADPTLAAQLLAAQKQYYKNCWRAARRPSTSEGTQAGLKQLEERNRQLATNLGFEKVRARAEKEASHVAFTSPGEAAAAVPAREPNHLPGLQCDFLPDRGLPVYWTGTAAAAAPRLVLTAPQLRQKEQAAAASVVWLALLLAVWALSFVPGATTLARRLWPEQLMLLGCLGILAARSRMAFPRAGCRGGRPAAILPWQGGPRPLPASHFPARGDIQAGLAGLGIEQLTCSRE